MMGVLIAGGGIGGLVLGLSLHAKSIPFQIFEAVEDMAPLGVGINLQPHAVRELSEMGLADRLDQIGVRTKEVAYFSQQGGYIWPKNGADLPAITGRNIRCIGASCN
jgi:2-polyprenyl-6-methoxyphenol hydroxylase-like FAD-dependent oxidoreductase